jgi:hypothetical protein
MGYQRVEGLDAGTTSINSLVNEGLKMVHNRKIHEITNQRKQRNALQSIRNNNQISSLADL